MSFTRQFYCLAFFLLLGIPNFSHAADWAPINPADLQIKDLPEQPGAAAFVIFHEETDDDLRHSRWVYRRIKVLNEAGRKYADVQIPYYSYKGNEYGITDVQGRTIHSDGSIVEFKGKPFDKTVVKSRGLKEQVKAFSLPDVQVGSILEYRYTLDYHSHMLMPPHWKIQSDLFQRRVHFRFLAYAEMVRTSHDAVHSGVAYTWRLPKGTSIKIPQSNVYELEMTDVPAFVEEEHMPPSSPFRYSVRFYYGAGSSADQYWKEEAKYWRSAVEQFMGKRGGVSDAVSKVTAAGDSPEQKAKKIYAFIGTLDNLSYKPRLSEQEMKALDMKERGVDDILRQHAGSQQELTLLFVAMARAAGLQAFPMWVTDRRQEIFDKNYLSTDQLDDYVAVATVDGKQVYLDPGTKFCPYALLYWPHSDSGGLRETAGGVELGQTPAPDYSGATTKKAARLSLNNEGKADGVVALIYSGQEAVSHRIEGSKTDDVGRTKILEDDIKSWLPQNAEITVSKEPDWTSADAPFVAQYKVSMPILISGGKRVLLPTNIFEFNRPAMFTHNDRSYPVSLEYPSREFDDIRIKLPEGVQVENLPPGESERVDYAMLKVERKQEGNELVITRDLAINAYLFAPGQYGGLKGFYDKVKESDGQQAVMKQGAHIAQN